MTRNGKKAALAAGVAIAAVLAGVASTAAFADQEHRERKPSTPSSGVDAGHSKESPEDVRNFWTPERIDEAEPQ